MKTLREQALDAAVTHGMALGSWAVFELMRRRSARFRRAVESFEAVYQFRAGPAARRLIFSGGRVTTRPGVDPAPDYEIVLLDPLGVVRQMRKNPNDMLRLLLENKISQRGNNYYLFKYGYLLGLANRCFSDLFERFAPFLPGEGGEDAA